MIENIFFLAILVLAGLFTIILSLYMGRKNELTKSKHMIPDGRAIYEDLFEQSKPLYSSVFPLAGKPDYILKTADGVIPVEIKTGNHNQPQKHHVMQLAAYCQLVEERFGKRPAYGLLVYYDSKKQFKISYTQSLKRQLSETVEMMKQISEKGWDDHVKEYIDTKKCGSCAMKSYCDIAKNHGR
ncbi:MAG: CRISPR-associated protein Cas4 [Thermoplasmatota archaeon]